MILAVFRSDFVMVGIYVPPHLRREWEPSATGAVLVAAD
jgi:hypothetical protein